MKRKLHILVTLCACFLVSQVIAQNTQLTVTKYKTDTAFTCIAVDPANGNVFAGTNGKGLVRYDQTEWKNWNSFGTAFLRGNLRQIGISGNNVWVASSGYVLYLGSPDAGNNINFWGGMHKMDNTFPLKRTYYRGKPVLGQNVQAGPPTRNILGVFVDSLGTPWCAGSYHDSVTYPAFLNYNARYHYAPGAVGRFNGDNYTFITGPALPDPTGLLIGVGNNYQDDNYSIGKRRTARCLTQVGQEMWVGVDGYDVSVGNVITAGILRYDLAGNYLGKFDQNNTGIPFGLTNTSQGPWSIYQDVVGRVWIGMSGATRGLAVRDTNGVWTHINTPANISGTTVFRANAINGNKNKEVFFGCNNGLLVYKGRGSFLSDTSYTLFTTADGLSSNVVVGIAIGKDESIWLATGAGVNKVQRGNLYVYNRKPMKTIFTDAQDLRTPVLEYNSRQAQEFIDKDTLLIAADGGKATIFKWTGASPQKMKFRFTGDINGTNPAEFGSFSDRHRDGDSLRVLMNHPKYVDDLYLLGSGGRNVRLQVVDSTQNPAIVMLDIPVKFVLPPVLMIHGIWSSTQAFSQLQDRLLNSYGNYKNYSVLRIWYENDRHPEPANSQAFYKYEVPKGITQLIENCAHNKMSAGRVDILGHSRGSIYARIYLQEKYVLYRNDINKLISLNTPHSGSQTANLALDKRVIPMVKRIPYTPLFYADTTTIAALFGKYTLETYDDINGAYELKVNAPAITQDLNGPANLNKNLAYSHALVGRHLFGQSTFADMMNSGLIKGNPSLNIRMTGLLLSMGVTKLDDFMKQIFNGEFNDIVVPESSQQGGLSEAHTSRFPGINVAHSNKTKFGVQVATSVLETPEAQNRILFLLRQKPDGGLFATDGYHPRNLDTAYKFLMPNPPFILGTAERDINDVHIMIDTAVNGKYFAAGDTVSVRVSKVNTDTLLISYGGRSIGVYSDVHFGNDTLFKFPIPADATGAIGIQVYGFNNGRVGYDSATIFVNLPAGVVLDSIKIGRTGEPVKILISDSVDLNIQGYYSDQVMRDITYLPGLTKTLSIGNVTSTSPAILRGTVLGYDQLFVNYGGKTDSIYLEVVPRTFIDTVTSVVLPVKFVNISAEYTGKKVMVKWNTSMEQNNARFEIEHSTDGNSFVYAGTQAATNLSNGSTYHFDHLQYVAGRNYYRIKQIDLDGKFSYSNIALAIVTAKNNITIYPNPVLQTLKVEFKDAQASKAVALRIINTAGQVVQQQQVAAPTSVLSVPVDNLAPGMYTIEIIGKNNTRLLTEKFVKNRL